MRPSESWSKARFTAAFTLVTAACWLIAFVLDQLGFVAVAGGFWPGPERFGYADSHGFFVPLWLTPITATLIHAGIIHLAFNLLILVFCGRRVENVLGPVSFLILYLLGAYAAAGAQYLVDPAPAAPMIGASGAISAVLGAYAMLFGRNRVSAVTGRLAVWINALWLMVTWVILQVAVGIASAQGGFPFTGTGMAIASAAHIGGFIIGVILAQPLLRFRWRKA